MIGAMYRLNFILWNVLYNGIRILKYDVIALNNLYINLDDCRNKEWTRETW